MRSAPPRHRLRIARRALGVLAWTAFAATAALTLRVALRGGSALLPAALLYGGAVAYGVAEMTKLRERVLFGPGSRETPPTPSLSSTVRWWLPRLLLVLVVAAFPAVLLLGGLP